MRTDPQWEKIGRRPHHGIIIPLFALHSKKSCGIGEFFDLIPLIDWCKSLKFDVIQLLPLNDSGNDQSPYNPISSCALDPIYLSLADLPEVPEVTWLEAIGAVLGTASAVLIAYFILWWFIEG